MSKKFSIILTVFMLPIISNCQISQNYSCQQFEKKFIKSDVRPKFYGDSLSLRNYFDSSLKKINYYFDARLLISINIDSSGTPCCSQILKSIDGSVDFQKIKDIVNAMPKWSSAKQHGHDVNATISILMFYTEGKLNVQLN